MLKKIQKSFEEQKLMMCFSQSLIKNVTGERGRHVLPYIALN